MQLPTPRGPLSDWLLARLEGTTGAAPSVPDLGRAALTDEDLQISLWSCYELSYRGFDEVADELEWDAEILAFRAELEAVFLAALRASVPVDDMPPDQVPAELIRRANADDGRSLSRYMHHHASRQQFEEFVIHRSVYHLKEADPHTWLIPRLSGAAKAAAVEIQADEYGGGRAARMHATLFADLMRGLRLDASYGRYVTDVPAITLATSNVMSLFGLHRSFRGAIAGHLAAFELTSSIPNRRYGQGLRRLGAPDRLCLFFDEHVEADAVHEQIAVHDLCGTLALEQPALAGSIVFGAGCALLLDDLFAEHLLNCWEAGRCSLAVAGDLAA